MSVQEEVLRTLGEAAVTDDYRVGLVMRRKRTALTWTQAEQLAAEILDAVADARAALATDYPLVSAQHGVEPLHHGFDVAPLCRDCKEGKHTACIGSAFVERGEEIDEVECGCERVKHAVIGGAA